MIRSAAIAAFLFSLAPAMATAEDLRAKRDAVLRESLRTLGQLRTSLGNCGRIYSAVQDATAQTTVMASKFYDMPQDQAIAVIGDGENLERAIPPSASLPLGCSLRPPVSPPSGWPSLSGGPELGAISQHGMHDDGATAGERNPRLAHGRATWRWRAPSPSASARPCSRGA